MSTELSADPATHTTLKLILERLDKQDIVLDRLEKKVDKTNGRVNGLELREAVAEGIRQDRAKRLQEEHDDETAAQEREHHEDLATRDRKTILFAAAISGGMTLFVFLLALVLDAVFHLGILGT